MRSAAASLWRHRGFVKSLVARDFSARYRSSALGGAWALLHPVAQIAVYTLIFAEVMASRLQGVEDHFGYSIFLCAGLLPWQYFNETLARAAGIFVEQSGLLQKLAFPRLLLPVFALATSTVNFLLIYAVFLAFLALTGRLPGPAILAVPLLLALQQLLAVGLGLLLGTLNVFFRDVGQILGIGLQFWFWLTPVVYPLKAIPERFRLLFAWNPMLPLVQAHQTIFIEHRLPAAAPLAQPAIVAAAALAVGLLAYRGLKRDLVDAL